MIFTFFLTIYILIYVDDILTTRADTIAGTIDINTLINSLIAEFAVQNMGLAYFFIGVELTLHPDRCFLSQHKYVLDILHRAQMEDAKPISIPMAIDVTLFNSSYFVNDPKHL